LWFSFSRLSSEKNLGVQNFQQSYPVDNRIDGNHPELISPIFRLQFLEARNEQSAPQQLTQV
jgi:hypothetical protein